MEIAAAVQQVLPLDAKLGEGVFWDAQRKVVWFVDIKRHQLWHFDPDSGSNSHAEAPGQIGWVVPAEGGLLLCGVQDGLYTFDPENSQFAKLMDVPGEPKGNRLNDACTDPKGRVWFGSMHDGETDQSGYFYLFDRNSVKRVGPGGIAITNGPAVNPAGDRIYFTDTLGKRILAAPIEGDDVGEAQLFIDTTIPFPDAYPDGPVVDAEGYLWSAFYGGGCVARFSPGGKLVAKVPIPARDVTKMGFGGRDFSTVYVTTATKNMEPKDMKSYPMAGSLFAFESKVKGFAQAPVKLS